MQQSKKFAATTACPSSRIQWYEDTFADTYSYQSCEDIYIEVCRYCIPKSSRSTALQVAQMYDDTRTVV